MIYQYVQPKPALQDFIKNYQIVHLLFNKAQINPYKPFQPRPEQGIIFYVRGNGIINDLRTGRTYQPPSVTIFGQQVSRLNIHLSQEYLMVKVNFKAGALHRLLGITLEQEDLDGASVLNREISTVHDRLANANSYAEMIALVDNYFLNKIKKLKRDIHPIEKVANCILLNPNVFSLDKLADEACLCPRQFDRKFFEYMGVTPKLYSRIVRFNYAYQAKEANPHLSWFFIAVNFGYNDYQHLVKDFKEFTTVTPSIWLAENLKFPKRTL